MHYSQLYTFINKCLILYPIIQKFNTLLRLTFSFVGGVTDGSLVITIIVVLKLNGWLDNL